MDDCEPVELSSVSFSFLSSCCCSVNWNERTKLASERLCSKSQVGIWGPEKVGTSQHWPGVHVECVPGLFGAMVFSGFCREV